MGLVPTIRNRYIIETCRRGSLFLRRAALCLVSYVPLCGGGPELIGADGRQKDLRNLQMYSISQGEKGCDAPFYLFPGFISPAEISQC